MSTNNVTVGIRLTVDGRDVQGALRLTADQLQALNAAAGNTTSQLNSLNQTTDSSTSIFAKYKDEILGLAKAYGVLKIYDYAKDATLLAARYETMGIVMNMAGNNAGYTAAQMANYTQKLEENGISMLKSRETMTLMAGAQLDLNKSTELGRMAQNLAVYANENSSETLKRLVTNIQQADTVGLKFMGVTVNQTEALNKYAAAHNTVEKALNTRQRAEAIMNAALLDGAKYNGVYEQAMTTAGKALNSLDRYFENIKVKLGTPFLEGFAKAVFGVTDGVKNLNVWLDTMAANGAMERFASNVGSSVGFIVKTIGMIATGWSLIYDAAKSAWTSVSDFYDKYKDGIKALVVVTVGFGAVMTSVMLYQAVPSFAALSGAAVASAAVVSGALATMVGAVRGYIAALQLSAALSGGWGALLGAELLAGLSTLGGIIASIPVVLAASVTAAGIALGAGLVAAFGDKIANSMPGLKNAFEEFFAWVDQKTNGWLSDTTPGGPTPTPAGKKAPEDNAAALAAAKAKRDKEDAQAAMQLQAINAQVYAAQVAADNAKLKAIDQARTDQIQQAYDQRLITQADFLRKKETMDVAEIEGQLKKVAADRAALAAEMAVAASGANGQQRDPTADKVKMIGLTGQETALQVQLNATRSKYAYEIGVAMIEVYTKEFGSIAQLVDGKKDLDRTAKEEIENAGKTTEQLQALQAQRLRTAADALEINMIARQASGAATAEETKNSKIMIEALRNLGNARQVAAASNFSATLIAEAKTLGEETAAINFTMKNSFIGSEEEKIRVAAANSKRLLQIRKDEQIAELNLQIKSAHGSGDTAKESALLAARKGVEDEFAAYVVKLNENTNAKIEQASVGAQTMASILNEMLDPNKPVAFGQALAGAFSGGGDAISKMAELYQSMATRQAATDAARKQAMKDFGEGSEKYAQADKIITEKQTKDKLDYYGNIAGAAKGFFSEQSKAYKALEAVEKVFHAASVALSIAEMVTKLTNTATVTAAKETAAVIEGAAATASVPVVVAAEGAKSSAYGITALAAALAAPFPANIPAFALVAAMLAAIGVAVGGGGGGGASVDISKTRQDAQGTGGVLGDDKAKSASIANSLEFIKKNSDLMLPINQGMLASLRNIEASFVGLSSMLARTPGLTNGTNLGITTGRLATGETGLLGDAVKLTSSLAGAIPIVGGLVQGIISKVSSLWGSTKQNIDDSGLSLGGNVRNLQSGQGFTQYADVTTTSSSWFGLKKSSNSSEQQKALDTELAGQFGKVFTNIEDVLKAAGKGLGVGSEAITSALNNMVVDVTKISTKGLTGDAVQKALEAAFSKIGDDMAKQILPGYEAFQQVGEAYLQTVLRVASSTEVAKNTLDKYGIAMVSLGSIANKTGDLTAELVRQSVVSVETVNGVLSGVGTMVDQFAGTGDELISFYATLVDLRKQMTLVNVSGQQLTATMISAAGGTEALKTGLSAYFDKFFTPEEKAAAQTRALLEQFTRLNVAMPTSTTGFRHLIEGIDKTTEGGQKLFGQLIALAPAFSDLMTPMADNASAVQSLQDKLYALTHNDVQTLAYTRNAELAAMDASLRPLQQRINYLTDEKALQDKLNANLLQAQRDVATALQNTITKMGDFAISLRTLKDGLLLGDLSPLSPGQKYAEAEKQYDQTLAAARAGDVNAQARYKDTLQAFLKASQVANASDSQYQADFARTQQDLQDTAAWAQQQVDVATDSLTQLKSQVAALNDIKAGVLTLPSALANLMAAKTAAQNTPQQQIESLYSSILGRHSDQTGLDFWTKSLTSGTSLTQISADFYNSPEYQAKIAGSHAMGLSRVPYDGYMAELHKDESVLTAAEAERYRSARSSDTYTPNYQTMGTVNMAPLVAELKAVKEELAKLRAEAAQQTGDVIMAQHTSTDNAAKKVVSGTKAAASMTNWQEKSKVREA